MDYRFTGNETGVRLGWHLEPDYKPRYGESPGPWPCLFWECMGETYCAPWDTRLDAELWLRKLEDKTIAEHERTLWIYKDASCWEDVTREVAAFEQYKEVFE